MLYMLPDTVCSGGLEGVTSVAMSTPDALILASNAISSKGNQDFLEKQLTLGLRH